jgi:hypothetical protein
MLLPISIKFNLETYPNLGSHLPKLVLKQGLLKHFFTAEQISEKMYPSLKRRVMPPHGFWIDREELTHICGELIAGHLKGSKSEKMLVVAECYLQIACQAEQRETAASRKLYTALNAVRKSRQLDQNRREKHLHQEWDRQFESNLKTLEIGESFLINLGWVSKRSHAIFCEIAKQKNHEFSLTLWNRGDGVSYHPSLNVNNAWLYQPFVRMEAVAQERLLSRTFLKAFHELIASEEITYHKEEVYDILMSFLKGKWITELEIDEEDYVHKQFFGVCAWAGLYEFLKPTAGKTFCQQLHLQSLVDYFASAEANFTTDRVDQRLLFYCIRELANKTYLDRKKLKEDDVTVDTLTQFSQQIATAEQLMSYHQHIRAPSIRGSVQNVSHQNKALPVAEKPQGTSLSFVRRHGKAYSEEFPDFFLSPWQTVPALGDFTQYTLLENDQGVQQVIIPNGSIIVANIGPLDPTMTLTKSAQDKRAYFVYMVDQTGALYAPKAEEILFLCYLFLGQKNYAQALYYLKTFVSLDHPYSLEAREIFSKIRALHEQTQDKSPDACAAYLHFIEAELKHHSIRDKQEQTKIKALIYQYLERIEHIPSFRLSNEQMRLIIDALQWDPAKKNQHEPNKEQSPPLLDKLKASLIDSIPEDAFDLNAYSLLRPGKSFTQHFGLFYQWIQTGTLEQKTFVHDALHLMKYDPDHDQDLRYLLEAAQDGHELDLLTEIELQSVIASYKQKQISTFPSFPEKEGQRTLQPPVIEPVENKEEDEILSYSPIEVPDLPKSPALAAYIGEEAKKLMREEITILTFANKSPETRDERLAHELAILGEMRERISMDDLMIAFLKQDYREVKKKNPSLRAQDVEYLNTKVYSFIAQTIQWRHVKKQHKDPSLGPLERHYQPHEHPNFLVFEFVSGKVLSPTNIQFFEKNPDYLIDMLLESPTHIAYHRF